MTTKMLRLDSTLLTLICALLLQTGGGIWWLSSLDAKVSDNCANIEGMKGTDSVLAVHTAQLRSLERNLDTLVTKLDSYITIQIEKSI